MRSSVAERWVASLVVALTVAACTGTLDSGPGQPDAAVADRVVPLADGGPADLASRPDGPPTGDGPGPVPDGPDAAPPDVTVPPDSPPPPPPPPPEPDPDTLPWEAVGLGVNHKDTQNPRGTSVFIGYGGYQVTDEQSQAWVRALYTAFLRDRGVRHLYAVRGPMEVTYTSREIQNTRLIATMLPAIDAGTAFIAVAGHSSGSYVAHELFQQLYEQGYDPEGRTAGRVVYFDLDGAVGGLNGNIVGQLRRAYFVSAQSGGTRALNYGGMEGGAATYPAAGGFLVHDASASGCQAAFCLHSTLVNTRPHDPNDSVAAVDYTDFDGRPVNIFYLEASGAALGP